MLQRPRRSIPILAAAAFLCSACTNSATPSPTSAVPGPASAFDAAAEKRNQEVIRNSLILSASEAPSDGVATFGWDVSAAQFSEKGDCSDAIAQPISGKIYLCVAVTVTNLATFTPKSAGSGCDPAKQYSMNLCSPGQAWSDPAGNLVSCAGDQQRLTVYYSTAHSDTTGIATNPFVPPLKTGDATRGMTLPFSLTDKEGGANFTIGFDTTTVRLKPMGSSCAIAMLPAIVLPRPCEGDACPRAISYIKGIR